MKTNEEITKDTYNIIAESYAKYTTQAYSEIRKMLDNDIDEFILNLTKKGKLLNVGAGDGRDSLVFQNRGYQTMSIDYSSKMKELAVRSGINEKDYLVLDIRELNENETFFGIWASTCLYHINKADLSNKVFPAFNKALSDKGIIYFNLFEGKGEILDESPKSYEKGGARFYAYWQKSEIENLLEVNKFEILSFKSDIILFEKPFFRIIAKKI